MRIFYKIFLFFLLVLGTEARAYDGIGDWWNSVKENAKATWADGRIAGYIPINVWHNRLTYDKKKIDSYNEAPYGVGVGKYLYDEDGNWHSLYAMGFKDSNYHLQTIFGYAYQRNWYLDEEKNWRFGAGYTLSLTQRVEYKMVPLPLPLPIVSFGYKYFSLQAAYVPGIKNNGNVLFTWLRVDF